MAKSIALKPLEDRIAVHATDGHDTRASGIATLIERPQQGQVVAVAPGRFEDGHRIAMDVRVRDRIVYAKSCRAEAKVDEGYLILSAHVSKHPIGGRK